MADLDGLAASLVGSAHLVASVAGRVRVQGTVTGVRRVFHASIGGAAVAADRADVLAGLLDAGLDEQRLALHLLEPHILYPLAGQPVWQGVAVLPTDHYLVLDGDGRHRSVRWWMPPEPVVPMAEGALALREALSAAVASRVRGRELVSCDLGGLDSTSVCSLAAHAGSKVVAYTAASPDPLADDVDWAVRTVAGLGTVEHHIISAEEMPLPYHGLHAMDDQLDEPCSAAVERERWLIIARRAAARGSRLHLTGFGGAVVWLVGPSAFDAAVQPQDRPAAAAWFRRQVPVAPRPDAAAAVGHQPLSCLAGPGRRDPHRRAAPAGGAAVGLGVHPRLPPWATPAAVAAVRELILAEAHATEPLATGRGQHRELEGMRFVSRITRQFEQMAGRIGVTLAAPYYDDRVIEAGLAVRPQERITPWRYKPLIIEAMGGIVPDQSLIRQTKANGSGTPIRGCDATVGNSWRCGRTPGWVGWA